MTTDQGLEILVKQVKYALRHAHYTQTTEVKKFARSVVLGVDQQEEVWRYRVNESQAQKDQRYRLYNPLTKYVVNRPRKYFQAVERLENAANVALYSPDKDKLSDLQKAFDRFHAKKTLFKYMAQAAEVGQVNDPNEWIIAERYDRRGPDGNIEETKVYPVHIPCEDVLNFERQYGELQWLLVNIWEMEVRVEDVATKYQKLDGFHFYAPGFVLRLREIGETTIQQEGERAILIRSVEQKEDWQWVSPDQKMDLSALVGGNLKDRYFYYKVFENGSTEVLAAPVGAYPDEETSGRSSVPWFWPGKHVLQDIIKNKSFLDTLQVTHVFAKRYEFTRTCNFEDPEGWQCVNGLFKKGGASNGYCTQCGGSGIKALRTDQDVLRLAMPEKVRQGEELLELSKLAFTETFPIELPEFQLKLLQEDIDRFDNAIFNAGVVEQAQASLEETATKTRYRYADIDSTVMPFKNKVCELVELFYRAGFQYREIKDATVDFRLPEDSNLASLEELLDELAKMNETGVGYDARRILLEKIIRKQNEDNPEEVAWIMARMDWMPFADKSEVERATILAARSALDPQRILWENHAAIFREIEADEVASNAPAFHLLSYLKQRAIVDARVEAFKARILTAGESEVEPFGEEQGDEAEPGEEN